MADEFAEEHGRSSACANSHSGAVTYNLNAAMRKNMKSPTRGQNNQFFPLRIARKIAPENLKKALTDVIWMHPSLRSSFHNVDGVFRQKVHEDWGAHLSYESRQYGRSVPQTEIDRAVEEIHQKSFLPEEPCAFAVICLHGHDETLLLAYLSHNITDAWGMRLLADSLARCLEGQPATQADQPVAAMDDPFAVVDYETRHLDELGPQAIADQCAALTHALDGRAFANAPAGNVAPSQHAIAWLRWISLKARAISHYGSVETYLLATIARFDMDMHDTHSTVVNVLDANRPTLMHRRTIMDLANIIPIPVERSDLGSAKARASLRARIRLLRQQAVPYWRLCDGMPSELMNPRFGISPLTVSLYPVGSRHGRFADFNLASELMRPPSYPYFDLILHGGPFSQNVEIPITVFANDETPYSARIDRLFEEIVEFGREVGD